jgi:MspA
VSNPYTTLRPGYASKFVGTRDNIAYRLRTHNDSNFACQRIPRSQSHSTYGVACEAVVGGHSPRCGFGCLPCHIVGGRNLRPVPIRPPIPPLPTPPLRRPPGRCRRARPATVNTPDGWTLALGAKDESQVPVQPLTTAVSSREYLASGTFTGLLAGPEAPRGVLEAGYEIGCGIDMSTSNGVTMAGGAGLTPSLGVSGPIAALPTTALPVVSTPLNGVITVGP